MDNLTLLNAFHDALWMIMSSVFLITIPTLLVGIFISIIQAATQVNEMSLTFIPKLFVMFIVLMALLPWLMNKLVNTTQTMMYELPKYIY